MNPVETSSIGRALAALVLSCCALADAQAGATITIINTNEPGVGFNDPTPVAPVGGNSGATLGQQRLIAFQHAADLWGATLTSSVPIRVAAAFEPLSCTADSAVLGAAGANEVFSNFANVPIAGTWYPSALASKISGADLATPGQPHIVARFNARLGLFPDCMPGSGFYLGLDNQFGNQIDLVTVLLHELGHGLGFQTFTDGATGKELEGAPSVWDHFLVDNRSGKRWADMGDAERVASAISGNGLSWNGAIVTAAVPGMLAPQSRLAISGAAGDANGSYSVGDAAFGPPLGDTEVTGDLMSVADQADGSGLACTPLSPENARAVAHNIALVDRGACAFAVKAKMVQDAGAIGMVLADNAPGDLSGMTGADPSITIPSVRITQADGARLKAALRHHADTRSGVVASLGVDPARLAGADAQHRALMYTPTVHAPGSSVSHYATDARPDKLMEPAINTDLAHEMAPPRDLTFPLLRDIGW